MVLKIFKIALRLRDEPVTISGNSERFEYLNFVTYFLKNKKTFSKNWSSFFKLKVLRLKMHHFYTKLPNKKPMLRQIEWLVQSRPITKNGLLSFGFTSSKILFQFKNLF